MADPDVASRSVCNIGRLLMPAESGKPAQGFDVKISARACLLAIFFLFAASASAITHSVRNETQFNRAGATAEPGDTIVIENGTYMDVEIVIRSSGEHGRPIRIQPEYFGGVVLKGSSSLVIKGNFVELTGLIFRQTTTSSAIVDFAGSSNSRLTQSVFVATGNRDEAGAVMVGLRGGSQNNRIDHNLFKKIFGVGIRVTVKSTDHHNTGNKIHHNYFLDIPLTFGNGQEAVQIGQNIYSRGFSTNTLVETNRFENIEGDAEVISNKSSSNTYRANIFRGCLGALTIRGGRQCVVDGNLFLDGNTGVRLFGHDHVVTNNYFENMGQAIRMGAGTGYGSNAGRYQAARRCLIAHNTFVSGRCAIEIGTARGRDAGGDVRDAAPRSNRFINNLFQDNGIAVSSPFGRESVWNKNVISGSGKVVGVRDDEFIRAHRSMRKSDSNHIYRPTDEMSGARISTEHPAVSADIDGEQRGVSPNIGADEAISGSDRPIKSVRKFGPSWLMNSSNLRAAYGIE